MMTRKCGICGIILSPENVCGGGIYPPDCQLCCEFMCNNCCVNPDRDDKSIAYCKKCFRNSYLADFRNVFR